MKELLLQAIYATALASKEVLKQYKQGFRTEIKADDSPVTTADKAAHLILCEYLEKTDLPILSEEGNHFSVSKRDSWKKYWTIDPIDGTKEFINKTGEYCVCTALIEDKKSVLGVLSGPSLDVFYFAAQGLGSFKFDGSLEVLLELVKNNTSLEQIIENSVSLPIEKPQGEYSFLASRHYRDDTTKAYIETLKEKYPELKEITFGSALKYGIISEGKAHEYTRFSPVNYWDIAAGDAIAKYAGFKVTDAEGRGEIIYDHPEMKVLSSKVSFE